MDVKPTPFDCLFKDAKKDKERKAMNGPVQIESIENCGNGYGWSIINHEPKDDGSPIFEIAVLKDGHLCYNTPITNDVIRGTWRHVCSIREEIRALPSEK